MRSNPLSKFIQQVRSSTLVREGAGCSDGQLLTSFIEERDEAAFGALVHLHGPMVWGVCRRVLESQHDAEDAFQATFLVLLRKATSIVPREMVGNWLYGVAYRTAAKARALAARRKGREMKMLRVREPLRPREEVRDDLQPLLDQELSRLPDKYRIPIVLCDLEGKTQREAAKQVGVPDGTLSARLSRARTMLAGRLARRGLRVSTGTLGIVLAESTARGCVPPAVIASTVKAAGILVAGGTCASAAMSPTVAALTEGIIKAMLLNRLAKLVGLAMLGALVLGEGMHLRSMASAQPGLAAPPGAGESRSDVPAKPPGKPDATSADRSEKEGSISALVDKVDADERTISVFRPASGNRAAPNATFAFTHALRLENLPVNPDAPVTLNGKPAQLADLKAKMRVVLQLEVRGGIKIVHIKAEDMVK